MPTTKMWPFPLDPGTKVKVVQLGEQPWRGVVKSGRRTSAKGFVYDVLRGASDPGGRAAHVMVQVGSSRVFPIDTATLEGIDEWMDLP